MILKITGDTHRDTKRILEYIDLHNKGVKFDMLMVCGDFGFVLTGSKEENLFLDFIEKEANFEIVFVDGNHENFPEIYSYPIEIWNGGKVHRIRRNIRHLMRGEIYNINGKTFFTFGGGYSIDKIRRLKYQEEHKQAIWWKEEFPSKEEIDNAFTNLESHNWTVDYIVTHSAPSSILPFVSEFFISNLKADIDIVNTTLEQIKEKTTFSHWFFGHYHGEKDFLDKYSLLYFTSKNLTL